MAVDAAAATGSLRTLGTAATAACAGNDSRLSDSRTPTAHKTSHQDAGSDEMSVAGLSGQLADAQKVEVQDEGVSAGTRPIINFTGAGVTAADNPANGRVDVTIPGGGSAQHNLLDGSVHPDTLAGTLVAGDLVTGNATPKWARLAKGTATYVLKAGATVLEWGQVAWGEITGKPSTFPPDAHHASHEPGGADPMAVDAAAATGSLRTLGTAATAACAGADARLSDARTPLAHGSDKHTGKIGERMFRIDLALKSPLAVGTLRAEDDYEHKLLGSVTTRIRACYARARSNLGTSTTFKLHRNGTAITGSDMLISAATRESSVISFTEVALADGDYLDVEEAAGGSTESIAADVYVLGDEDVVAAV
jgi:hypothetical protein